MKQTMKPTFARPLYLNLLSRGAWLTIIALVLWTAPQWPGSNGLAAAAELPLRAKADRLIDCSAVLDGRKNPFSAKSQSWRSGETMQTAPDVTPERLMRFTLQKNRSLDLARFGEVAAHYKTWGEAYGLRWDLSFFQMLHETNYLRYTGGVKPGDFNFSGIGATVEGKPGARYASVEEGVKGHLQHLAAYALIDLPLSEFVRERDDTGTLQNCKGYAARCRCIRERGSYTLCVRGWIMEEVCQKHGRPATLEFLDTMFAQRNRRPDRRYSAKVKRIAAEFAAMSPD